MAIHGYIRRSKRCVLAYVNKRLEKIQEATWKFWNVPKDYSEFLSNDEKEYLQAY